jgi:hypothetical protein
MGWLIQRCEIAVCNICTGKHAIFGGDWRLTAETRIGSRSITKSNSVVLNDVFACVSSLAYEKLQGTIRLAQKA